MIPVLILAKLKLLGVRRQSGSADGALDEPSETVTGESKAVSRYNHPNAAAALGTLGLPPHCKMIRSLPRRVGVR
jgi:hypothetical protein